MGMWMELHCDVGATATTEQRLEMGVDILGSFCRSHNSQSHCVMVESKVDSVRFGMRHLEGLARKSGWTKTRAKGWTCPRCRAAIDKGIADTA